MKSSEASALIVEDEELVCLLVEDMMFRLGYRDVRSARDVATAVAEIEARAPDIAILDIRVGDAFVYGVAERLEALGTPFVFITGFGKRGMDDRWARHEVLLKPFSVDALGQAIAAAKAA